MTIKLSSILTKLKETIDHVNNLKLSGEIVIQDHLKIYGKVYVISGKILYMADGFHRVRRWQRALVQYNPQLVFPITKLSDEQPWEYQLLIQGINEKRLSITQAKGIVSNVIYEILLELTTYSELSINWQSKTIKEMKSSVYLNLSVIEIYAILLKLMPVEQEWLKMGLGKIPPRLAPIVSTEAEKLGLGKLAPYLNGKYTFWDIALATHQSLEQLTKELLPLISKGLIKLREIGDLENPYLDKNQATKQFIAHPTSESQDSVAKVSSNVISASNSQAVSVFQTQQPPQSHRAHSPEGKLLIACIDDSPVVAHNLKRILEPAGYQVIGIKEPMRGFSQLIEQKPSLIFLDLNLPNTNGYSICQFLRTSSAFENIPIIIITAQDTLIDRGRAKLVGATDFLAKPAQPQEILKMVQKYLPS